MTAVGGGTNSVETVVTSWAVADERRLRKRRALVKAMINLLFFSLWLEIYGVNYWWVIFFDWDVERRLGC